MGSDPRRWIVPPGPRNSRSAKSMSMRSASTVSRSRNVNYLRYVLATRRGLAAVLAGSNRFADKMAKHPVIGVSLAGGRRLLPMARGSLADRSGVGKGGAWPGWPDVSLGERTSRMDQEQHRPPGSKRGAKYPPLANVNRYDQGVSPYGVYQMAGNVSEWVSDWFDPEYYRRADKSQSQGPASGQDKVFRGGSWNEDPEVARSAGRNSGGLDHWSYLIGFRCAESGESGRQLSAVDPELLRQVDR